MTAAETLRAHGFVGRGYELRAADRPHEAGMLMTEAEAAEFAAWLDALDFEAAELAAAHTIGWPQLLGRLDRTEVYPNDCAPEGEAVEHGGRLFVHPSDYAKGKDHLAALPVARTVVLLGDHMHAGDPVDFEPAHKRWLALWPECARYFEAVRS